MSGLNDILKTGFLKILDDFIIGRSVTYPEGWIKAEDLRKIADMIDNGQVDKFGNNIEEYDK